MAHDQILRLKCDRCQTEEDFPETVDVTGWKEIRVDSAGPRLGREEGIDLCPACSKALTGWLQNLKTEAASDPTLEDEIEKIVQAGREAASAFGDAIRQRMRETKVAWDEALTDIKKPKPKSDE